MAYVRATGLWFPNAYASSSGVNFTPVGPLVASADRVGFVGKVWIPDRGVKNITKVGFRFYSGIVKAGGSALTLSLQDVDLVNGPPFRWDGVKDQQVAIPNTSIVSSTWLLTAALSATRAVAHGDRLAVVVEYDGAGRLGSDSMSISTVQAASSLLPLECGAVSFLSSTYASVDSFPNVLFEFDDGTFGVLDRGIAISAVSPDTFNSGSATNIIGLQFTVPFNCKVDGAWVATNAVAGANFDLVLYSVSGSSLSTLATSSVDANAMRGNALNVYHETIFTEQTLVPGTTYYLGLRPMTTNNVTLNSYSVAVAEHLDAFGGGSTWVYNTAAATTLGAPILTRRPLMGLRISAVDDGTGTGGGGVVGVIGS